MEIEEGLLVGTVPGLSNNLGVHREPYCLLESLKEVLQKLTNLDLRLLQGTSGFKGQIHVPMCIIHHGKVTTGSCCLFR